MAYLKFPLDAIPEGTVSSAKMRLYLSTNYNQMYSRTRCVSDWSEQNFTAPTVYAGETQYYDPVNTVSRWVEHDTTTAVQNWLSGTWSNYGYRFWQFDTTHLEYVFRSTHDPDTFFWPRLVVTYNPKYDVTYSGSDTPVNMNAGQQCVFQAKTSTHSERKRALIPTQSCH